MKKILFTILVVSLSSIGFVKAQALDTIPNANFTRWHLYTVNKVPKGIPEGWDTVSGTSYPTSDIFYIKGSEQIHRQDNDGVNALSLSNAIYGKNSIGIGLVYCKFPLHNLDAFLNLNIAYFGGATQVPFFRFIAYKHDSTPTSADTAISVGYYINSDTIEPWSTLSLPLTVKNNIVPDSAYIIMYNSYVLSAPYVNPSTVLDVEKVWFSSSQVTTGIDPSIPSNNSITSYPNPFTDKTTIHYSIKQSGEVNLSVYDMNGKLVSTLVNGNQSAGTYNKTFDASGLTNGLYIYKLQTATGVQTGKLILNR